METCNVEICGNLCLHSKAVFVWDVDGGLVQWTCRILHAFFESFRIVQVFTEMCSCA